MTQVVQASELTLHEVKTQLGLQEAEDEQFFSEWQEPLSKLTDVEQRSRPSQSRLSLSKSVSYV